MHLYHFHSYRYSSGLFSLFLTMKGIHNIHLYTSSHLLYKYVMRPCSLGKVCLVFARQ